MQSLCECLAALRQRTVRFTSLGGLHKSVRSASRCDSQCLPTLQTAWLQVPTGPLRRHLIVAFHTCVDPHAGHLLAELPQHVVAVAHLPGVSRERRGGCRGTDRWAPTKKPLIGLFSLVLMVLLVLLVPCAFFSLPLLCLRAAKQAPQEPNLALCAALQHPFMQPDPPCHTSARLPCDLSLCSLCSPSPLLRAQAAKQVPQKPSFGLCAALRPQPVDALHASHAVAQRQPVAQDHVD